MRLRDWIKTERRRRSSVGSELAFLYVRRTRRSVRVVAIVKGEPRATVHLDEAGVDRLIERLTAVRGGQRALRSRR